MPVGRSGEGRIRIRRRFCDAGCLQDANGWLALGTKVWRGRIRIGDTAFALYLMHAFRIVAIRRETGLRSRPAKAGVQPGCQAARGDELACEHFPASVAA